MLDFKISNLVTKKYNLMDDYNFVHYSMLINEKCKANFTDVFKDTFFQKMLLIYCNILNEDDLKNVKFKRSPGMCREWIKNIYE